MRMLRCRPLLLRSRLLWVLIYLLDTVAVWLAVGPLDIVVEIAHGSSFDTPVEVPGELLVDNAILGHANDAPYIHFSILKALIKRWNTIIVSLT
jgi:hypothetical protein